MPSLQCPDCGERHALEGLGGAAAFRCRGCERVLKVPEQLRAAPAGAGAEAPSAGAGAGIAAGRGPAPGVSRSGVGPAPGTEVGTDGRTRRGRANAATAAADARRSAATAAAAGTVSVWMRLLIWIVAIPLGAALVFGVAEALGVLTSRQLIDTFLESGMDRFGAVARLLPFWALVSAALVHLAVMGLDRRRASRGAGRNGGNAPRGQRRDEREPARAGS